MLSHGSRVASRSGGQIVNCGGRRRSTEYNSSTNTVLYAPEAGGFIGTGPLVDAREGHTATVLGDGTVLVVGGVFHREFVNRLTCDHSYSNTPLASAELFK
jgi:hypothetical protein